VDTTTDGAQAQLKRSPAPVVALTIDVFPEGAAHSRAVVEESCIGNDPARGRHAALHAHTVGGNRLGNTPR